jgi:methionine-rich copper-binding protein CopC
LDNNSISTSSFSLKQGETAIECSVKYVANMATLTTNSSMDAHTMYTATVSTGVKDLDGLAMKENYSFSFTTGAAPDVTKPTIVATDPLNNAVAVSVNKAIVLKFSEFMDPLSIDGTTISLMQGTTSVAGEVTYADSTAKFTPTADLAFATSYSIKVTTGVTDFSGNAIAAAFSSSFTTMDAPDLIAPTVSSIDPANNNVAVAFDKKITVTFSEAILWLLM